MARAPTNAEFSSSCGPTVTTHTEQMFGAPCLQQSLHLILDEHSTTTLAARVPSGSHRGNSCLGVAEQLHDFGAEACSQKLLQAIYLMGNSGPHALRSWLASGPGRRSSNQRRQELSRRTALKIAIPLSPITKYHYTPALNTPQLLG